MTMRGIRIITVLTLALAGSGEPMLPVATAHAADSSALGVVIETLPTDASACGLTLASIEPIVALALRNNGVRLDAKATEPYLYIRVTGGLIRTVTQQVTGCDFDIHVSVQSHLKWTEDTFRPRKSKATLQLCNSGGLYRSGWPPSGSGFLDAIEHHIKLCLGRLDY